MSMRIKRGNSDDWKSNEETLSPGQLGLLYNDTAISGSDSTSLITPPQMLKVPYRLINV